VCFLRKRKRGTEAKGDATSEVKRGESDVEFEVNEVKLHLS
jgi:hypothetical protein